MFVITQIGTLINTYNFDLWNKPTCTHSICMHVKIHAYLHTYFHAYVKHVWMYMHFHWQSNLPHWTKQNSKKKSSTYQWKIHNTILINSAENKNQQQGNQNPTASTRTPRSQACLNETIILNPSPNCNLAKQPTEPDWLWSEVRFPGNNRGRRLSKGGESTKKTPNSALK